MVSKKDIKEAAKGTPVEDLQNDVDALYAFKNSPGHSVLVEYANKQMAGFLSEFIHGEDDVDLNQLRANFRAWYNLVGSIDENINSYEVWLKGTLEKMNRQIELQQRGMSHGAGF